MKFYNRTGKASIDADENCEVVRIRAGSISTVVADYIMSCDPKGGDISSLSMLQGE